MALGKCSLSCRSKKLSQTVVVLGGEKGKNLLGHSEELGDARLVSQAAEGGACVGFSILISPFTFQTLSHIRI